VVARRRAEVPARFDVRAIGYIETIVLWERRTMMYWYNPTTRTSERVAAPSTDEEAVDMLLSDDLDSAEFVKRYNKLRGSGTPIELALVLVGHESRLRQSAYELALR